MPTDVEAMIDAVIRREIAPDGNPYVNDPTDKGGATCYGITETVARAYGYMGPMPAMTLEFATDVYRKRYWYGPGFDRVNVLCTTIANKLFDIGVNMGQATGVRFLQRALNVLNDGLLPDDFKLDGVIGPITLHILQLFLARRGEDGRQVLLAMLRGQQAVRYIEIAEISPAQKRYVFGWEARRAML
jgi:lysozyme family protein